MESTIGKHGSERVVGSFDGVADAVEERAGIISATCSAPYVDAFARLKNQKPIAASDPGWQLPRRCGPLSRQFGCVGTQSIWGAGDLFDVPCEGRPGCLAWQLSGESVASLVNFTPVLQMVAQQGGFDGSRKPEMPKTLSQKGLSECIAERTSDLEGAGWSLRPAFGSA